MSVVGRPVAAKVVRTGDLRPRDESGREIISVKGLLEWAFAVECASLDYDEVGAALGIGLPAAGAEYRVAEQLALGMRRGEGVRPDTSFGRSLPHDDAEIVATILRNAVPFYQALRVAELARGCSIPKWDLGRPRLEPVSMHCNRHGWHPKTEDAATLGAFGWRPQPQMSRRGAIVRKQVRFTPCRWNITPAQIAAARRGYLDWWGALLAVAAGLKGVELSRFVLSGGMPPLEPWRKSS